MCAKPKANHDKGVTIPLKTLLTYIPKARAGNALFCGLVITKRTTW